MRGVFKEDKGKGFDLKTREADFSLKGVDKYFSWVQCLVPVGKEAGFSASFLSVKKLVSVPRSCR